MAYFRDLTPFVYGFEPPLHADIRNVGWLDVDQPFPTGTLPEAWLDRLWNYCKICVSATRGLHPCPFCPAPSEGLEGYIHQHRGERLLLHSAEIRAFSSDGRIFAAPNLIFHYVASHGYRPPDPFIEALATLPEEAYRERLTAYGIDWSENPYR